MGIQSFSLKAKTQLTVYNERKLLLRFVRQLAMKQEELSHLKADRDKLEGDLTH